MASLGPMTPCDIQLFSVPLGNCWGMAGNGGSPGFGNMVEVPIFQLY